MKAPVVDANGNIYISTMLMGVPTLTTESGTNDVYTHLISYTPTGILRWTRTIPNYNNQLVCVAPEQLLTAGTINYTTSFDGISVPSTGRFAAYVGKLKVPVVTPPIITPPNQTGTTQPAAALTIPTVITPNGDRQNEYFRLPGLPAVPWQLDIYNRWGSRVYHSDNYRQDWNAPGQPDGQYYYYLQAPNRPSLKGWLEVIH